MMHDGFSLIELLLVMALVIILAGTAAPFFSNMIQINSEDNASQRILSAVRVAQQSAMNRRFGAVWGVCISGENIRVFSGSCAMPTTFQDTPIPEHITVSGFVTTTFNRRGEPSAPVTFTLTNDIDSQNYTLNAAGRLSP